MKITDERQLSDDQYNEWLEGFVKQMLTPKKDISFAHLIRLLTGKKVISFDGEDADDRKLLTILNKVAQKAGEEMNSVGVFSRRVNEVGNHVEPFVKQAMQNLNLSPATPGGRSGKAKSSGYPDILFNFNNSPNYLECKTYNMSNINTTFRAFYLSPGKDFKVVHDAHHFLLSYQMIDDPDGKKYIYKCRHYKLLCLGKLLLDLKFEFNTSNKKLYSGGSGAILLSEGSMG